MTNGEPSGEQGAQPARLHYGWVVLAVGTLAIFGALGLARFGYSLVLPAMQKGLALNNTQSGILAAANLVGYLLLAVAGGMLASRFGPRTVITLGLVTVALGMAATGLSRSFAEATLWRTITGLGSGATNIPVMGLMSGWFALKRRGLASGIAVSGSSLGLIALGPAVPRLVTAYGANGWRACWVFFAVATVLLAALAALLLRNRPADRGLRPVGDTPDDASPAAGTAGLNWGRVYRSPAVWHLGACYIAFGFSYMIYMTFFAKALIADGGYSPRAAGQLFMLMGWCSLACGLLWGAVSDWLGRKAALIMVYAIQAVSFALFALCPTPHGFTASAVLYGLTAWSIPAIMAAACGDVLGARLAAAGIGFVTLFMGIGQAAGPVVAGAMADASQSFLPAMLLAAVVALVGAALAAFLRPLVLHREEAGDA